MQMDTRQSIASAHPQNLLLTNSRIKVVIREGQSSGWQEEEEEEAEDTEKLDRDRLNEEMIILIINNILLYLEMGMIDGMEHVFLLLARLIPVLLFAAGWTGSDSRDTRVI